jgi:PAS domain-containing protein
LPAQREIEELLQFIYLMPVAVVRMGETGAVELLNPKAVQLLQDLDIDAGSGDGCLILESLCPGLQQAWLDSAGRLGAVVPARRISSVRAGRQPLHLVLELTRPDARCTMLLLEDVTVVVEQERELSRARRRMDLALEHIHGCCVLMLDVRGNVMESNPSISRMFGGTEADIVGHSVLRPITFDETSRGPALDFETISLAVGRQGWCNLESRIVHPGSQRKGIGSKMLADIESRFPEVSRYELFTGSKSAANIRLYRRHGYKITHTQPFSETVSITFMEKLTAAGDQQVRMASRHRRLGK